MKENRNATGQSTNYHTNHIWNERNLEI